MIARKQIQVRGMVQSIGFRPFVYGLAQTHGFNGRVCNNEQGVLLDLEGPSEAVELEQIAGEASDNSYEFEIAGDGKLIRAGTVIRRVVEDLVEQVPAADDIRAIPYSGRESDFDNGTARPRRL
jgi:acylphosphatase